MVNKKKTELDEKKETTNKKTKTSVNKKSKKKIKTKKNEEVKILDPIELSNSVSEKNNKNKKESDKAEVSTNKIVKTVLSNIYNLAIEEEKYSNLETLLDIFKDELKANGIEEKEIKKLKLDKYKKILEIKTIKELEGLLVDNKYSPSLLKKIAKDIYKKEIIEINNSLKNYLSSRYSSIIKDIKDYKLIDTSVVITFTMSIVLLGMLFSSIGMFKILGANPDITWVILLILIIFVLIVHYTYLRSKNKSIKKNRLLSIWTLIGNVVITGFVAFVLIMNHLFFSAVVGKILQANDYLYNQLRLTKVSLVDLSAKYNKEKKTIQTLNQENQKLKGIIIKQEQEKYIFAEKFKNQLIDNIIKNLIQLKNQHIVPPKKEDIQKQLEKLQNQKINTNTKQKTSIKQPVQK